ncbi:MAG: M6 family metalloprotease domain-containing protein [Candidatus Neomarinimicrobiota bacterium]|nr:M6 family metalloprotease domain-containing protein [Candidatus Neomarinimicrobiota bacterium]
MRQLFFINIIFFALCRGHFLDNIPITLKQPDGVSFSCLSSGNHYYVRLHDDANNTIIQSEIDGYYYYAQMLDEMVVPTEFRADNPMPKNLLISQGIKITREEYLRRKSIKEKGQDRGKGRDAPTIGTINNINIFIRFSDEEEFSTPRSVMDEPFNKIEGPSISHYYDEVSYSQLEVITHHFPSCEMSSNISYQDVFPRSYYQPFNAQTNPNGYTAENSTMREHTLLKNAIEFISHEVPLDLDVDGNNDGYVDNVTFLVSGSPDGWSDLLWPHRWSLYSFDVWINGSIVDAYNLNLATGGYFTVGTLCHEFFHSLGAPDLYHYNDNDAPIAAGGWDVMDGSSDTPQYMGAWMKHKYGNWIDCPVIEQLGIYPLLPLQYQENSCFRINSPNSNNEFFVVEYRNKNGLYEINTPGNASGMLVYRINGNLNGNADGPPDEIYVYRPGGTTEDNGNLTEAIFSEEVGRTEINDSTNPSSFLYGGAPGGLNIRNIGPAGDIIEFIYWNIFVQTEIVGIMNDDDGDGILNPGESAQLVFSSNILSAPSDAENVMISLDSDLDWLTFNPSQITLDELPANGNLVAAETELILDDIDVLEPAEFSLQIDAEFSDNGMMIDYSDSFDYALDVTLNQFGFPITMSEVRSSPLILDIDGDGNNEIIISDYSGIVHIYDSYGIERVDDIFPFITGNQIWASPSAADLDGDGHIDFAIASKDKHLYVFDHDGLKIDYETDVYLIGTPSIGNIDDDEELEIVFSGYSINNKIFAINHDGSDVEGFPLFLGEKCKAGPALADFNDNGKDDIVIGTDDDNLYLIYDNGEFAPGFPYVSTDKIQVAPSIAEHDGQKVIFFGNIAGEFIAINDDGSLRFQYNSNDRINTSPSFINVNESLHVLFGSKVDSLYMFDMHGNETLRYPVNGNIEGGIIVADLDGDENAEIIASMDGGEILALTLDGSLYHHFPLKNDLPFTGAPIVMDIDQDEDLEIMSGVLNGLVAIDVKDRGVSMNHWNMYRGNNKRNGYFISLNTFECSVSMGDVNGDEAINVLDLVQISYYILEYGNLNFTCAADINEDDNIDILDLVVLINFILNNN